MYYVNSFKFMPKLQPDLIDSFVINKIQNIQLPVIIVDKCVYVQLLITIIIDPFGLYILNERLISFNPYIFQYLVRV